MRDRSFVRQHRGGRLTLGKHRLLMQWALICARHSMRLVDVSDPRVDHALKIGKQWEKGAATVGQARLAAVAILRLARELKNPAEIAVVRGVGHAVATAHMADHALGPAYYAQKAIRAAGGSAKDLQKELAWQLSKIPRGIRLLVICGLKKKGVISR